MKRVRTAGFTVVELLVGMAIISVVLLAIGSLQTLVFQAFTPLNGSANRLRDLQDASGYVGDRVRSATAVSTSLTVNGVACATPPAAGGNPCFALLVPEAQQVGSTPQYSANAYLYLAYALIPRSQLSVDDKTVNSWADSNTLALVEYRQNICQPNPTPTNLTGTCTASSPPPAGSGAVSIPAAVPAALTGMSTNIILDSATTDASSGTFVPFAYDAVTATLTLAFRLKQQERGATIYTPTDAPLQLTVKRRN